VALSRRRPSAVAPSSRDCCGEGLFCDDSDSSTAITPTVSVKSASHCRRVSRRPRKAMERTAVSRSLV
jgi:hypothetical protein